MGQSFIHQSYQFRFAIATLSVGPGLREDQKYDWIKVRNINEKRQEIRLDPSEKYKLEKIRNMNWTK